MKAQTVFSTFGTAWPFWAERVEYKVCLFGEHADALRAYDYSTGQLKAKMAALPFCLTSGLRRDDDGHWAFYVQLYAEDDTPTNRCQIATVFEAHLTLCCELADMQAIADAKEPKT